MPTQHVRPGHFPSLASRTASYLNQHARICCVLRFFSVKSLRLEPLLRHSGLTTMSQRGFSSRIFRHVAAFLKVLDGFWWGE